DKYDPEHSKKYFKKLGSGFLPRLSTWREIGMARKALALAGNPKTVLDLPCGTGRFWELLAERPDRRIFAADNSQDMINTGMELRPPAVTARIEKTFQCSAFATGLPDRFVECVFSIRLMHHIEKSQDRILMLKEFRRISSGTVIMSEWVDGNYTAWRRAKLERQRALNNYQGPRNRFVIRQEDIEREISAAGLEIVGHIDFLKYFDKKRVYVLRTRTS
ncbi:MAG: class I SAM-dependent methyltransferase, partial [Betaproteobacteria bacterium]|nr:class I SAM-dependent methyltransferase [Betaproteobacteria bacterium]